MDNTGQKRISNAIRNQRCTSSMIRIKGSGSWAKEERSIWWLSLIKLTNFYGLMIKRLLVSGQVLQNKFHSHPRVDMQSLSMRLLSTNIMMIQMLLRGDIDQEALCISIRLLLQVKFLSIGLPQV